MHNPAAAAAAGQVPHPVAAATTSGTAVAATTVATPHIATCRWEAPAAAAAVAAGTLAHRDPRSTSSAAEFAALFNRAVAESGASSRGGLPIRAASPGHGHLESSPINAPTSGSRRTSPHIDGGANGSPSSPIPSALPPNRQRFLAASSASRNGPLGGVSKRLRHSRSGSRSRYLVPHHSGSTAPRAHSPARPPSESVPGAVPRDLFERRGDARHARHAGPLYPRLADVPPRSNRESNANSRSSRADARERVDSAHPSPSGGNPHAELHAKAGYVKNRRSPDRRLETSDTHTSGSAPGRPSVRSGNSSNRSSSKRTRSQSPAPMLPPLGAISDAEYPHPSSSGPSPSSSSSQGTKARKRRNSELFADVANTIVNAEALSVSQRSMEDDACSFAKEKSGRQRERAAKDACPQEKVCVTKCWSQPLVF